MELKYIIIISCLLLLAFVLYKEVSRVNKERLIWRILANIFAILCFALLLIPIKYETHLKQNKNEMVLLTNGANADSVAKIKGTKYALASADLKNVKSISIPSLPYFLAVHKEIKKLNIYGYGLSDDDLKNLKGYEINFHPFERPNGIISANWQPKFKASETLNVQGLYQNTTKETVKLILKGLGKSADSVTIEPKSNKKFSLSNQPKQIGKAIYQLIALIGQDTLSKEPVPFLVDEQLPMKVLILASSPDFEYKFLKKWLYENHYPLTFRSQISKNKYSLDFLNMNSLSMNNINASSLKKFDVLVIDEEELAAINANERAAIDNAVKSGLGLIIRISGPKSLTTLSAKFNRYVSTVSKNKQLGLSVKNKKHKFTKLPLEQSLFIKANLNDQALVADDGGKTLVNSTISGSGKVLASTISSTFNWFLAGKTADYSIFWSEIFSKAARKKSDVFSVKIAPEFPVIKERTRVIVDLNESAKIPSLRIDSNKLAPRQNMELPFQWDALFYPVTSGWKKLWVNQSVESIYIYREEDWQTLKNQQTIISTQEFAHRLKISETNAARSEIILEEELSKWWFFCGLLFSLAFLWYESKILNTK